jgi:hypothetical protein
VGTPYQHGEDEAKHKKKLEKVCGRESLQCNSRLAHRAEQTLLVHAVCKRREGGRAGKQRCIIYQEDVILLYSHFIFIIILNLIS